MKLKWKSTDERFDDSKDFPYVFRSNYLSTSLPPNTIDYRVDTPIVLVRTSHFCRIAFSLGANLSMYSGRRSKTNVESKTKWLHRITNKKNVECGKSYFPLVDYNCDNIYFCGKVIMENFTESLLLLCREPVCIHWYTILIFLVFWFMILRARNPSGFLVSII